MADIGKITPGNRIIPRGLQDPLPERERSDEHDDQLQDDADRVGHGRTPEEHDDENRDGGIDVYV